MPECCGRGQARYDDVFDDRFAHDVARRYRRRGLTTPEHRIVDEITAAGIADRTVMEIGGGVGELQIELLRRGAAATTNVELSSSYEREAGSLLAQAGFSGRARRIVGIDLAAGGDELPPADHVILHRVVCCYPDAVSLLASAAAHARRTVTFSHPPRTWLVRTGVAVINLMMRIRGREYRGYVHSPDAMYDALRQAGLDVRVIQPRGRWRVATAVRS